MKSECVFCQKIDSGDVERESIFVSSFEPLNPVTPGHRLFVPNGHREHTEGPVAMVETASAIQEAHKYGTDRGEDFNLITSSGDAATQTIPHIHIHYVPRRAGDGLTLPWTGQEEAND